MIALCNSSIASSSLVSSSIDLFKYRHILSMQIFVSSWLSIYNCPFHCWFHLFSSSRRKYEYRRPREHKVSTWSGGGGWKQWAEVTKRIRTSFEAGIIKLLLTNNTSPITGWIYSQNYYYYFSQILCTFFSSIISYVTNIFGRHYTLTDIKSYLHLDQIL